MKKGPFIWPLLASLLVLAGFGSCSRHNVAKDNGCISRYQPSTSSLVTTSQLDTLDLFFHKNNLSISGLQFLFLDYDSDPNNFFGSYHGPYYQASADLILNGLRMPSFTIAFVFDSTGNLLDSAGGYFGELPNNDTTTHQSLAGLRQSFLNSYKQCVIGGGCMNCTLQHPTVSYLDTCLIAQLVYVDASIQNNSIPSGQQLVKAWLVSSADNPSFPEVTVIDSTGQAIPLEVFFP